MINREENTLNPRRDERNPSQVTDDCWIDTYRQGPGDLYTGDGTWVIYALRPSIDSLWRIVMLATEEGYLGSSATVSTATFSWTAQTTIHAICIRTDDRNDREEAMRIRGVLRELLPRDDDELRDIAEWRGDVF